LAVASQQQTANEEQKGCKKTSSHDGVNLVDKKKAFLPKWLSI
jgi:hypothetical protein